MTLWTTATRRWRIEWRVQEVRTQHGFAHEQDTWLLPASSATFAQGTFWPRLTPLPLKRTPTWRTTYLSPWPDPKETLPRVPGFLSLHVLKGGDGRGVWIFVVPIKFPLYWANSNRALDKNNYEFVSSIFKET
jgi:hypothetical protein